MIPSVEIRSEIPSDHEAVRNLTVAAFEASEFGHNGEADLITELRHEATTLSLVASVNVEIVGHIMFSAGSIKSGNRSISGMGLAPMSVHPDYQGKGIGSILVQEGMNQMELANCQFVFVLGHPTYYPRFGFEPATNWIISHGFAGIPQDVFFIKSLAEGLLEQYAQGRAYYSDKFGPQHMDFDDQ